MKGRALIRKHGEVDLEDLFTGESPSTGAATYVAAPLTFLLKNEYEPVEIDGIDIAIAATEEPRTATIERIWLDTTNVRPGRTVPLKILMRSYRGEAVTRTVTVDVPANASGPLTIMVADGSRLAQWEQREARQSQQAQGVTQMVRALNKARKNNRLYVRLLAQDSGAVVGGEFLSSLPPSVLAVMESDRSGGQFVPLRSATLGEWDIPTDYAVTGARFLSVNVDDQLVQAPGLPGAASRRQPPMPIRFARPLAAVCLLSLCAAAAHAAGARFWQVSTQTDFLAGEVENLSIDMHGRLLLGPQATRVGDSTTPFLWRLVQAPDGSIYGGSGNDGQVFRFARERHAHACSSMRPSSRCTRSRLAPGGGLYVGTSPDGKIYRVDAKGTSTVYFDPEDKYIWSLVDRRGGRALRRHWREGRHLSHHGRRQGRAVLQDEGDARAQPAARPQRRSAGGHRSARQGVPHQEGRQRLPAARQRPAGDQRAAARRQGRGVCLRVQRQTRRDAWQRATSPSPRRRGRSRCPRSRPRSRRSPSSTCRARAA